MGKYVERNLGTGEKIIYEARLHWSLYINPVAVVVIGIFFLVAAGSLGPGEAGDACGYFGYAAILIGVIYEIYTYFFVKTAEFVITSKRIISKRGIIGTKSLELLLSKAESIAVDQNISGKMFGFGSVRITGSGGSANVIPFIEDPFKFRKVAQEEIEKVQKK